MNEVKGRSRSKMSKIKKSRMRKKLAGAIALCLLVVFVFQTAAVSAEEERVRISVKADSQEIFQEEAIPPMTAKVVPENAEDNDLVLDEKTGYKVSDLMDDLNGGSGFTLECEADGIAEGEFPIHIALSKEIEDKVKSDWVGKVFLKTEDGTFKVKNKTGQWEGDKFKRYDGTYVANEFVVSKGKTYYFGEDSIKVTGWQDIHSRKYNFDKEGVMQAGMWIEKEGTKCYLNEDGSMATGWTDIEGATYYFNEDGSKMTGNQQIGSLKCVFAEDGKLESKESSIDPNKPMMALTFDDGPGDRTNELLDVLMKYDAHATFYMQGINIPGNEDTVKKMVEAGCEIGSHTFNHPQLTKLDAGGIQKQMGDTDNLLIGACGQAATSMRPPYGAVNDIVKATVGKPMILWNIDTLDWKTKNAQATVDNVMQTADDGDIVLMHDIHSTSVDAAIQLIPMLVNKGYQLVTVTEMAEARGITLDNTATYTDFNK